VRMARSARTAISVTHIRNLALSGRQLQPGRSYTATVVGPKANLRGILLADNLTPATPGKARVRFVDTLVGMDTVNVVVGGRILSGRLTLGSAGKYQDLKPGKYRVQALQAGTGRTVATGARAPRGERRARGAPRRSPLHRWPRQPPG
jgi:hypothetical protein